LITAEPQRPLRLRRDEIQTRANSHGLANLRPVVLFCLLLKLKSVFNFAPTPIQAVREEFAIIIRR
jgi:hypothetical protein